MAITKRQTANGIRQTKQKIPYQRARLLAASLIDVLAPLCEPERCVMAGSVRRGEDFAGDVEIICVPKTGSVCSPGELLPREQNLVMHYIDTRRRECKSLKLIKGGRRYQQITVGSTQVDIFMTNKGQWGRMLAIRTGPKAFCIKMAQRWNELGFTGKDGWLIPKRPTPVEAPTFPTEQDFFDFLGWDFVPPEGRR